MSNAFILQQGSYVLYQNGKERRYGKVNIIDSMGGRVQVRWENWAPTTWVRRSAVMLVHDELKHEQIERGLAAHEAYIDEQRRIAKYVAKMRKAPKVAEPLLHTYVEEYLYQDSPLPSGGVYSKLTGFRYMVAQPGEALTEIEPAAASIVHKRYHNRHLGGFAYYGRGPKIESGTGHTGTYLPIPSQL